MGGTVVLDLYVSHKEVHAAEVVEVDVDRKWVDVRGLAGMVNRIDLQENSSIFARYMPIPGDFYVVYSDGYSSFSPKAAFVEGYSLKP